MIYNDFILGRTPNKGFLYGVDHTMFSVVLTTQVFQTSLLYMMMYERFYLFYAMIYKTVD